MQQAKPAEGKITVILISRAMIQLLIITRSQEARKRQWHVPKHEVCRRQQQQQDTKRKQQCTKHQIQKGSLSKATASWMQQSKKVKPAEGI